MMTVVHYRVWFEGIIESVNTRLSGGSEGDNEVTLPHSPLTDLPQHSTSYREVVQKVVIFPKVSIAG